LLVVRYDAQQPFLLGARQAEPLACHALRVQGLVQGIFSGGGIVRLELMHQAQLLGLGGLQLRHAVPRILGDADLEDQLPPSLDDIDPLGCVSRLAGKAGRVAGFIGFGFGLRPPTALQLVLAVGGQEAPLTADA